MLTNLPVDIDRCWPKSTNSLTNFDQNIQVDIVTYQIQHILTDVDQHWPVLTSVQCRPILTIESWIGLTNVNQSWSVGWAVLLGVCAGVAGLVILIVVLACRWPNLKPCLQVTNISNLKSCLQCKWPTYQISFLNPIEHRKGEKFVKCLDPITNSDHHQLVEEQEGRGEEAQLWGETILGPADFPQL